LLERLPLQARLRLPATLTLEQVAAVIHDQRRLVDFRASRS
jgi:hypothetical protein